MENYFATVKLINSTVSGNSAGGLGGAIDNWGGTVEASNATITLNRADADGDRSGGGGAIYNYNDASKTVLHNTLLAGNRVGAAGSDAPNELSGVPVDAASAHNLIGDADSAGGLMDGANGNIVGVDGAGTIDITTVIDTQLADNGGPTLTHALLPGSLAIDRGNNALVSGETDQTGLPRILGGDADEASTVDIGAVEHVTASGLYYYLQQQVSALGEAGTLKTGDEMSLLALLSNAWKQHDGDHNPASSKALLEVYMRRVSKLVDSGAISSADGDALTGVATMLLDSLVGLVASDT